MTAQERARVREIVEQSRREQGFPPAFPPEVCAEVARLIAACQAQGGDSRREPKSA